MYMLYNSSQLLNDSLEQVFRIDWKIEEKVQNARNIWS